MYCKRRKTMDKVYEMSKSLPNKWLNPDGSITDGQGNIISPASETGKAVYKSSKSFVNKFVDTDGEIKKQAQISMDIFTPVDKLTEIGEKNIKKLTKKIKHKLINS